MALFQDVMDYSRIVEPLNQEGKSLVCKVYWKDSKGSLDFGGITRLPASLFDQTNPRVAFIGFREYHRD
jgi:hypothetical protein